MLCNVTKNYCPVDRWLFVHYVNKNATKAGTYPYADFNLVIIKRLFTYQIYAEIQDMLSLTINDYTLHAFS